MYTLVYWETNESMPETIDLDATTLTEAEQEADKLFPNADSLLITRKGSNQSLNNRCEGEQWPPHDRPRHRK